MAALHELIEHLPPFDGLLRQLLANAAIAFSRVAW
jgi:hypothetical protein